LKTITYNNQKITPSKVVCIGRNYVEHIKELGNETPDSMVIFNKPNSAISNKLNFFYDDTRYEAEICFLIKNNKIEGIGFGLDLTHASIQNKLKQKGLPWERAKAFNGSAVFGDFIQFDGDIKDIELKLYINNNLIQHATYNLMIYKPFDIVKEISSFMTLEDGDIIMSGTPKGVGTYKIGDIFKGEIYYNNNILISNSFIVGE